jgi:predicted Zn-dependent protease
MQASPIVISQDLGKDSFLKTVNSIDTIPARKQFLYDAPLDSADIKDQIISDFNTTFFKSQDMNHWYQTFAAPDKLRQQINHHKTELKAKIPTHLELLDPEHSLADGELFYPKQAPITQRLQNMTEQIKQSSQLDLDIEVLVQKTDTVGAFNLGSGRVIVTTGLLNTLKSDAEVASIIGHELVHGLERDQMEVLSISAFEKFLSNNETALKTAMKNSTKDIDDQYTQLTENFNTLKTELNYQKEYQADRLGIYLVDAAGHNPNAAKIAHKRLRKAKVDKMKNAGYPESMINHLLTRSETHPPTPDRVSAFKHTLQDPVFKSKHNQDTGAQGYLVRLKEELQQDEPS